MAKKAYKVARDYWNGKALVATGEVDYFDEGKAPKGAVPVKEKEEK